METNDWFVQNLIPNKITSIYIVNGAAENEHCHDCIRNSLDRSNIGYFRQTNQLVDCYSDNFGSVRSLKVSEIINMIAMLNFLRINCSK